MIRRLATAWLAAWLVLGAIILGRFADEPLPPEYLIRPLLLAAAAAVVIALISLAASRYAAVLAAGGAMLVALPQPAVVLSLLAVVLAVNLLARHGRIPSDMAQPVLVVAGVFFALGLARAVSVTEVLPEDRYVSDEGGPPMYVVLLDGYPRMDSLDELGIDNGAFVHALEERGFDHYPAAHSTHSKTNKTLLSMLTDESVNDDPVSVAERRRIRSRLVVPPGFIAIDPPIGYVTLSQGPRIDPGWPNDFDAQLLGQSAAGALLRDAAWAALIDGLRQRLARSLEIIETTEHRRVFAHLMAPHPPFLYGPGGSTSAPRWCWPGCGFFTNSIQSMGIDRSQWARGMAEQLMVLNAQLLETVDLLIAQHPDAVIVLVSDHGGRLDLDDLDEWHRSFLVARTPGHPDLFAGTPRPDTVIRTLLATYAAE